MISVLLRYYKYGNYIIFVDRVILTCKISLKRNTFISLPYVDINKHQQVTEKIQLDIKKKQCCQNRIGVVTFVYVKPTLVMIQVIFILLFTVQSLEILKQNSFYFEIHVMLFTCFEFSMLIHLLRDTQNIFSLICIEKCKISTI